MAAQVLPEEPISLAGGHVVFGAEVAATFAPEDPGFFNYTSYEFSALRNFRMGVSAEIRANDHIQVLGEVRLDQGRVLEAYGLFVRVRPWPARRFDIQAGRIPPTFGAMSRTAYGSSNLLIGQPLAYQYLTSIRPDALPATTDDLLRMRGRGWLSNFPVGNTADGPGLPLVNTSRWDTGVQAHGVIRMFEWTGSVTAGSLSDPRFRDNNGGRQFAGRVVVRPAASHGRSARRRRAARGSIATLEDQSPASSERAGPADRASAATRSIRRARSWCAARRSARRGSMPAFGDAAARPTPLVAIVDRSSKAATRSRPGFYVADARRSARLQQGPRHATARRMGRARPGASKPASAIR